MPTPARSHLPIKSFILESGLLDEEAGRDNEADVALLRLPAPALRGTFAKAYELLTKLVSQIGWDELLRCRSQVFVMEEEYRAQKANRDGASMPGTPRTQEMSAQTRISEDDKASTTAIAPLDEVEEGEPSKLADTSEVNNLAEKASDSVPSDGLESSADDSVTDEVADKLGSLGVSNTGANGSSQSIPTIRISSESDHEKEKAKLQSFKMGAKSSKGEGAEVVGTAHEAQKVLEETGAVASVKVDTPPLEKPAIAQAQAVGHSRTESQSKAGLPDSTLATTPTMINGARSADMTNDHHEQNETTVANLTSTFSFSNKRLCERWLDNLFMVLYEDLRVYTIWRAEVNHYKQQSIPYRKSSTEWEILGELALRLHHKEEAKEAFQRCVDGNFSAKAYLKLLDIYTEQKDVERSLWTALRLTAYHHRWYMENTFPGSVAHSLFKLIGEVGLSKVNFTLVSMSPPEPILKLMKNYFAYCQAFKVPGFDS
jgi:hypothetical protein